MTWKRVTCNSFSWNKAGNFRTPILCPNTEKKASKLHAREIARATLHPNKEIKSQPWTGVKRDHELLTSVNSAFHAIWLVIVFFVIGRYPVRVATWPGRLENRKWDRLGEGAHPETGPAHQHRRLISYSMYIGKNATWLKRYCLLETKLKDSSLLLFTLALKKRFTLQDKNTNLKKDYFTRI